MNCGYSKCKKLSNKIIPCGKCSIKLCSNNCLIEHSYESHEMSENPKNSNSKIQRKSVVKSPFMKMGEFLQVIQKNPLYDFKNFEYVLSGKKPKVLGAGAFGDVYLARNKVDKKLYAIKHMEKFKIIEHGAKLEIVEREIHVHQRLVHENIIRMHSYYEDKDSFYIIMDYASGQTLFSLIKKKNGMPESTAFKYFIHATAAVNFLHDNNLVHRDLKPENLLIDENDNVKLCDFGWCVEIAIGSRSTFCGTYEYMAPEIINESPYNSAIDVWSLGILLYELLHGYSPFRAKQNKNNDKEHIEIFRNIVKYNFTIDKEVSESCEDLLKKLLNPETKNRMKVKDIFSHPWTVGFEKEFKEQRLKEALNKEKRDSDKVEIRKIIEKQYPDENNAGIKKKNIEVKKEDDDNDFNLFEKSSEKSINSEFNQKKLKVEKIEQNGSEFTLLNDNNSGKDNLFDKVLNQVKEKNRNKKRKKEDSPSKVILKEENSFDINQKSFSSSTNNTSEINIDNSVNKQRFENQFISEQTPEEVVENSPQKQKKVNEKNKEVIEFEPVSSKKNFLEYKQSLKEKNMVEKNIIINEDQLKKEQRERELQKENMILKKKSGVNDNLIKDKNNKNENNKKYDEDREKKILYEKAQMKALNEMSQKINYKGLDKKKTESNVKPKKGEVEDDEYDYYKKNQSGKKISYQSEIQNKEVLNAKSQKSKSNKDNLSDPRRKDEKEIDYDSIPKNILYNDEKSRENNNNLLAAIDILEKAQENRNHLEKTEEKQDKSFWSFLNPFKCGNNN